MILSELGELGLIERLSSKLKQKLPDGVFGIGDDCAVIPVSQELSYLITTDALIEDIHFFKNKILPQDLGHKSLAVNLSDIAAMGGIPHSVFLTLSLPKDLDVYWIDKFFDGFQALASKHNTLLLGGDTTGSVNKIAISLTMIGYVHPQKIKFRSSAQLEDIICVTDFIGDSGAGLASILENQKETDDSVYLISRHFRPEPNIEKGVFLAGQHSVNAMMDVSDGVYSDIQRIMKASHCGVNIDMDRFPISDQLRRFSKKNNIDELEMAATGGEDYCLLFTVSRDGVDELAKLYFEKFKQPFYPIGEITSLNSGLVFMNNKKIVSLQKKIFNHF